MNKKIDVAMWVIMALAAAYFVLSTIPYADGVNGLWAIVMVFAAMFAVAINEIINNLKK